MGQRKSGFERKEGDEYMTPEWVAETLCHAVPMYGNVWEPACGEGAIARVMKREKAVSHVSQSDLNPAYDEHGIGFDFLLADEPLWGSDSESLTIVTNPPYGKQGKIAEAFVRHALLITKRVRGRVCMLLPFAWDAGKKRQDMFEDFPAHVTTIRLTERIRWTNLPQSERSGPSENHAWFVWDWSRRGRDQRWLGRVTKEAAE